VTAPFRNIRKCEGCGRRRSIQYFRLLNPADGSCLTRSNFCCVCTRSFLSANARRKNVQAAYQATSKKVDPVRKRYKLDDDDAFSIFSETRLRWHLEGIWSDKANHSKKRKETLERATPRWADLGAIDEVYLKAKTIRERSGGDWVVDHIVPITSDLVCGLHVHWNLQIITKRENSSKGNKFDPDQVT
jgi:5-methylcytosine-specific restriction endonuclease McrA